MSKKENPIPPRISHADEFTASTYASWLVRLFNIAMSRGKWNNLPETIDPRFIEETLIFNPAMAMFKDKDLGPDGTFLALPCTASNELNPYGYPVSVDAYGYNGYSAFGLKPYNGFSTFFEEQPDPDCSIIYCNLSRVPEYPTIVYYARKLTKIDRTMDVNVNMQKAAYLLFTDTNTISSVINMFKMLDSFEPAIIADKNYELNQNMKNGPIQQLNLSVPYIASDLQVLKRQVLQEALTALGIEANTSEKAERQITGEISANMGETESIRNSYIMSRQIAAEQFNKIYGTGVTFEFNSDLSLQEIMNNGGIYNGKLYNVGTGNLRDDIGGDEPEPGDS